MSELDKQMIMDVREVREADGLRVALLVHNYHGTDLLVASSRVCDDGAEVDTTVLINNGTGYDVPVIIDYYHGCPNGDPFPFEYTPRHFYH